LKINPWYLVAGVGVALLALAGVAWKGKKMNTTTVQKIKNYILRTYNHATAQLTIVGIRGASLGLTGSLERNSNKTDDWNDLVCLIEHDTGTAYEATIDPGSAWLDKPMNTQGTARIEPGLYRFKRGLHDKRPAFVSASSIRVRRDGNRDKIFDAKDKVFADSPRNRFGINIHASYGGSKVGRNSAGCTVLKGTWNSADWTEFRDRLYRHPATEFVYVVIDAKELT